MFEGNAALIPAGTPQNTVIQRMQFLEIFSEGENEALITKVKMKVNNQEFNEGESFRRGEKIAGVNFHILRFLDIAVTLLSDNIHEVKGFLSAK